MKQERKSLARLQRNPEPKAKRECPRVPALSGGFPVAARTPPAPCAYHTARGFQGAEMRCGHAITECAGCSCAEIKAPSQLHRMRSRTLECEANSTGDPFHLRLLRVKTLKTPHDTSCDIADIQEGVINKLNKHLCTDRLFRTHRVYESPLLNSSTRHVTSAYG